MLVLALPWRESILVKVLKELSELFLLQNPVALSGFFKAADKVRPLKHLSTRTYCKRLIH